MYVSTVNFMLWLIFVIFFKLIWSFLVEANLCRSFIICLYMYCPWISINQKGSWDPIHRLIPPHALSRCQAMTWISNVIYCDRPSLCSVSWGETFLFILLTLVWIVDHYCFKFLFIVHQWCFIVWGKLFLSAYSY